MEIKCPGGAFDFPDRYKENDKMITKDTKEWILMHTNDKKITKDTKQWILMHTSDKIATTDTKNGY